MFSHDFPMFSHDFPMFSIEIAMFDDRLGPRSGHQGALGLRRPLRRVGGINLTCDDVVTTVTIPG